jgi:tetratricopeptide (TPR) repeat protein
LFIKLVGKHHCDDRDAVRQILAACGRLPLAIRLIAGWLRHHRGELLTDVAADFAGQTAALDALVAEHLSVRAAFEWSYRLLNDEQRRAFRRLGWHPGPEISQVVIAATADVSPAQGKQLLRELVDHNLLDQLSTPWVPGGPRYRMHDLVRLYARERADAEEPPAERAAAVDRLAGSYLAITHEADRLLRPYALNDLGQSTAGEAALAFADASQAHTWLTVERHNLLGSVQTIIPTAEAADLSSILAVHFLDFGFWSDARYLYRQALTLYRHLDDPCGEADALWGLGEIEWRIAEYRQANEYYTQALALARHLDHRRAETEALRGLGHVKRLIGEYGQAREHYTQALALARHLGYRRAETEVLWGLGQIKWLIGECSQAREHHTQALTLSRQLGYRFGEILALRGLGEVGWLVGEYDQAREYYTQALILGQLGYQFGEVFALWGLGEVERLVGEYDQARDYHTQALALARQCGYRLGEAEALWGLGHLASETADHGQACQLWRKTLEIYDQIGAPFAETVRAAICQLDVDPWH